MSHTHIMQVRTHLQSLVYWLCGYWWLDHTILRFFFFPHSQFFLKEVFCVFEVFSPWVCVQHTLILTQVVLQDRVCNLTCNKPSKAQLNHLLVSHRCHLMLQLYDHNHNFLICTLYLLCCVTLLCYVSHQYRTVTIQQHSIAMPTQSIQSYDCLHCAVCIG